MPCDPCPPRLWQTTIQQPTLVLHGDQDSAIGTELLTGMEAAVPNAQVYLLSPCSHWVQQVTCSQSTSNLLAACSCMLRLRTPGTAAAL